MMFTVVWQLSLDTNWNSLCVYNVGRQARSSDCNDTVFSAFKYRLSINRTNTVSSFNSLIAHWLAHWPLDSGVVRSDPANNIFLIIKLLYYHFFISLFFLFIFLNFEVKQCANIYWKYDNTGFAMEKKPNFFFSIWLVPHIRAKQDRCVVIKHSIQGTMLLSRWKWPCTLLQILYKRKKERFAVLEHFGRSITLAVFDIPILSTESQVLYSFIIKVRMDTLIFYFLIFFW